MKKFITLLLITSALALTSCGNQTFFDSTYTYDYAMILLPDGTTVEGEIESWMDISYSDMIQIRIGDTTYLTHSCNVIMTANH